MKSRKNTRRSDRKTNILTRSTPRLLAGMEALEGRMLLTTPVVLAISPLAASAGIPASAKVSVAFNTSMDRASLNASTFQLRDISGTLITGRVSYNDVNKTATFDAAALLAYSTAYTATVQGGGGGVKDIVGDTMPSTYSWSFTTSPSPDVGPGGPILIVTNADDAFSTYYAEILRNEGLNEFATIDLSSLSPQSLSAYDVVILGSAPLSSAQVTTLSNWVSGGGHLIAMRPDKQLAGVLGLSDAAATVSNAYLLINTASGPGAGLVDQTIQFHGAADAYTANGASTLATLYSDANTATSFPAVTVRNFGSGQAAAFTYDLARSVVYSRQGNPAWAGRDRDGDGIIRSDDLFYGPASFDPQQSWIDFSKIAIPQADEQQRLLGNLITQMELDKAPLPHFWYLPDGAKAAVVMTGDDHNNGGTVGRFTGYSALGPVSSTPDWQTVRATSYIYTSATPNDAQAAAFTAAGFEIALHVSTNTANWTPAQLDEFYSTQLAQFNANYLSIPTPATSRTHAITWSDYTSQPTTELKYRIRLDTNYYYYPAAWLNNTPGLFTASGMPMRFADASGHLIDVYQATTQMTDESGQIYPFTINSLLDAALGPQGYYGAFTVNAHTDTDASAVSDAIITSALSRGVPVISSRQLLDWLDGRNSSSFSSLNWNAASHTLSFIVNAGQGANGLRAMLPSADSTGLRIASITCDSVAVPFTRELVKGIEYAIFPSASGAYTVTYAPDTTPPAVSSVNVAPAGQNATITWTTNEPADSRIIYGTSPTALTLSATDPGRVNAHSLVLTNLFPNNLYYYRIVSTDAAGNTTTFPASGLDPLSFNAAYFTASIWNNSTQPAIVANYDGTPIEAGVKFRSDTAGYITGIRFYKGPGNTGTHTGHLWTTDGTLLGTVSFANETAGGWQQATFDTPILIAANTTYIVSYYAPNGHYASNTGYFANSGADNGPLHALANGADGSNGVFNYGGTGFPASSYNAANYWVDVVFTTQDKIPPTVTSQTPAPGAIDVATDTGIVINFSEPVQPATVSFVLTDSNGNSVPATVTFDSLTAALTATLKPTVTLAYLTTFTAAVSGAKDLSNNVLAAPVTWSFTTAPAVDTKPPTVTSQSPAPGATAVSTATKVVVTFSEPVQPATVSFVLLDGNNNAVPATVTFDNPSAALTATLTPSAQLAASSTYTATVSAKDLAGNLMTPPANWSFTTAAVQGQYYSIWSSSTVPQVAADSDTNAVELGVKFRSDVAGYITGIRFYKGSANTGTHTGHLWTSTGTLLGTVTFTSETTSGWQQATFATPIAVSANTTYVASYFAPAGRYSVDSAYFSGHGADNAPLHALASGVDGNNGVYRYTSTSAFPSSSYNSTNYWVDVVFATTTDSQPPTITTYSPASGATGVANNSSVVVNFSEPVQPATLSFTLVDANNKVVPATVTFDSPTSTLAATLKPTSGLIGSTTYTATVSGAKDLSGNAMTAPMIWSFTTIADTTIPAVATQTPLPGATGVATNASVVVTFTEAVQPATVSFTLVDPNNNPIAATVSFDNASAALTATLKPKSALANFTLYTATVSGAKDMIGNSMAAPVSWTFTTVADTTPSTIKTQSPASGATGVSTASAVVVTFSEAVQPATISFTLMDANSNPVPATLTFDNPSAALTVTLTPTAELASLTTFTATVSAAKDLAGNTLAAPVTWSFTTMAPVQTGYYSIWASSTKPAVAADSDTAAVELGVKFRSDVAGYITGIRFYKGSANTGTHTGHLWTSTGTLLGTVTFTSETTSGWQQALFATPIAVSANTTYVASYFAPAGRYSVDSAYFSGHGADNAPLHALASGVDGNNGVYRYTSTSAFPSSSYNSTNYWVDVVFSSAADTTPPALSSQTPAPGATAVATTGGIVVNFSEPIQPATLSFTLVDANNNAVPATLTFDSATSALTATLKPTAALVFSTTYTATVSGAKDLSGNAMAAPVAWSFTTVADTAGPTVKTQNPAPGATGVATGTGLVVTFSEPVQPATVSFTLVDENNALVPATLTFDNPTGALTATLQPLSPLANDVTYTAFVSGATDLAGNPMLAPCNWSFTTTLWQQTTVADFSAGTTTGTVVTNASGGELALAPVLVDSFNDAAVGTNWTTSLWTTSGAATESGGTLSLAGAQVRSTQSITSPAAVEGYVSFGAAAQQAFGFATNLPSTVAGNYWAVFGTKASTTTLYARVNVNGTTRDVSLGAIPTGFHLYKVRYLSTGFEFYIDNVLKTTIARPIANTVGLKIAASALNASPKPPLVLDWINLDAYVSGGTYVSQVFDAGQTTAWGTVSWNATLPSGTSLLVETSSGNTPTPDATWSAWTPVTNGGVASSPAARYLRYRITFITTDPSITPTLLDITFA